MDSFFEAEVEMERKICRDVVCTSNKDEEGKRTSVFVLVLHLTPLRGTQMCFCLIVS